MKECKRQGGPYAKFTRAGIIWPDISNKVPHSNAYCMPSILLTLSQFLFIKILQSRQSAFTNKESEAQRV